jgi:hypothetical protein
VAGRGLGLLSTGGGVRVRQRHKGQGERCRKGVDHVIVIYCMGLLFRRGEDSKDRIEVCK